MRPQGPSSTRRVAQEGAQASRRSLVGSRTAPSRNFAGPLDRVHPEASRHHAVSSARATPGAVGRGRCGPRGRTINLRSPVRSDPGRASRGSCIPLPRTASRPGAGRGALECRARAALALLARRPEHASCTPRLDPARKQPFHPWSRSTVGSAALGSERVRRPGARQRSGAGTFRGGVPGVAPPWPSDRERGAQGGGSAGLTVYRSGAMRERSWTNLWVSRRRVSSSGARRSELGWTVAIT